PGAPVPNGSVLFNIDGNLTSAGLVNGQAAMNFVFNTLGTHSVTGIYVPATAPTQLFESSVSTTLAQNVRSPVSLALSSASTIDGALMGASVSGPGGPPTGTVTFSEVVNGVKML